MKSRFDYMNAGTLRDPLEGVYPTKEDILEQPRPLFRMEVLKALSEWKLKDYHSWAHKDPRLQWEALERLMWAICKAYNVKAPVLCEWENVDRYDSERQVITLKSNSIISLLHELGHHLYGPSEYHACRFSVWIYQLRFNSAYQKLVWDQHMLVSRSE